MTATMPQRGAGRPGRPWRRTAVCLLAAVAAWAAATRLLAQQPGGIPPATEVLGVAPEPQPGAFLVMPVSADEGPAPPAAAEPATPSAEPEGTTAPVEAGNTGEARAPASAIPYMLGDLLRSTNAISFHWARVATNTFGDAPYAVNASGAITLRNTKVADNNNAIPEDRVSYEYNFFKDGQYIEGTSLTPTPSGLSPPLPSQYYATKRIEYDVNLHTIAYEKSFADGLFSLEARIPFANGLLADQHLNGGRIDGEYSLGSPPTFFVLDVTPTPQDTWGSNGWEIEDVSLILKAAIYRDPARNLWFSGGLQVVAPTARNVDLTATDFFTIGFPSTPFDMNTVGQRLRTFHIDNQTWAVSPFLALSMMPRPRTFFNAFLQLDVPVGADTLHYSQRYEALTPTSYTTNQSVLAPFVPEFPGGQPIQEDYTAAVHDQVLAHLDLGAGWWLYENPQARWLRGVAPTLEFHLTQTLGKPDVLQLPASAMTVPSPTGFVPEPVPTVGNPYNITLTDVTVGIDALVGKASVLAVGAAFPLGTGNNRTFDSEVLVKFNRWF
jgi:hypothetical protein